MSRCVYDIPKETKHVCLIREVLFPVHCSCLNVFDSEMQRENLQCCRYASATQNINYNCQHVYQYVETDEFHCEGVPYPDD